jgi:hypothetical protein
MHVGVERQSRWLSKAEKVKFFSSCVLSPCIGLRVGCLQTSASSTVVAETKLEVLLIMRFVWRVFGREGRRSSARLICPLGAAERSWKCTCLRSYYRGRPGHITVQVGGVQPAMKTPFGRCIAIFRSELACRQMSNEFTEKRMLI